MIPHTKIAQAIPMKMNFIVKLQNKKIKTNTFYKVQKIKDILSTRKTNAIVYISSNRNQSKKEKYPQNIKLSCL